MKIADCLLGVLLLPLVAGCGDEFTPGSRDNDAGTDAAAGSGGSAAGGTGGSAAGGSGGTAGTGGVGGGGSGGTAGEAGTPCPTTHVCVSPVPSGWTGPIADVGEAPCPAEWASEQTFLHDGLNAPAAQCECTCTPKVNCPTSLTFHTYGTGSCSAPTGGAALAPNTCKAATTLPYNTVSLAAATAACGATVSEYIPEATWANHHRLCSGAQSAGTCANDGELCVSKPNGKLCVYQEGDLPCPAGYETKTVAYTGAEDDRDCPATCSCAPAGTAKCVSTVTTYSSMDCTSGGLTGTLVSGTSLGGCIGSSVKGGAITQSQTGTCSPPTLSPSGAATPKGATTICCTN